MVVLIFDPYQSTKVIDWEFKDINSVQQMPYDLVEKYIFAEYFINDTAKKIGWKL
jgi:hypothetical protein